MGGDSEHALSAGAARNGRVRIRVVVLAADQLSAQGTRALLERSASIEADCCSTIQALERRLAGDRADAVVWFARHATAEVLDELRLLRERLDAPLCIVAERVDADALRRAYVARPEGIAVVVRGPDTEPQTVFRTLVQLLVGTVSMSPEILDDLLAGPAGKAPDPLLGLTAAELAVLELVALGLRNGAIAARLGRSRKLVEKQVGRVFAKIGLRHDAAPELDRRVMAARAFLLGSAEGIGEDAERIVAQALAPADELEDGAEAVASNGHLPELAAALPALGRVT